MLDGRNLMSRKINIRPTTGVYATYKNIKYDPWTAIAEFVDNSTQSYYDNKKKLKETKYWKHLNVEIIYEKDAVNGDKLIIRDNAYGMDFHDFQRAIILDSPPSKKTRSEFGMGLKTAACWFGKNWSVESTALGSDVKYFAEVDVEALHKYKNEEIEVKEENCNPKEHGTVITIWNLNRTITGRQIGKTKDQLRGMYRVDIRTGEIEISYNGENLNYEEPEILQETLPDGSIKTWKQSIEFTIPYNDQDLTVSGFIALRKKANTSLAGFALIRRGRVIIGGYENAYRPEEIFEKPNSFVYQRLFGEINMDDWPVTQTKDAFDWYSGLEDALIEHLNEVCSEYKKKAKEYRVGNKVSLEETTTDLVTTFSNAGVISNADVKAIDEQLVFETVDNVIQNIEGETEESKTTTNRSGSKLPDIVVEGPKGKTITFDRLGESYVLSLILEDSDAHKNWLNITRISPNQYTVNWNIRHPFFKPYIDDPKFLSVMEQFVFAMALTEIEIAKTGTNGMVEISAVRMKMNDILKEVAKEE